MTTSDVKITPGLGVNVATFDITEDSEIKKIQRIALTDATGVGTAAVTAAATLAAETTKAIGVVRNADGSGSLLSSTANALDVNIKSGGNVNGRAAPSSSSPVVLASQAYQDVAASATATVLTGGGGGALGDYLDQILVVPETVGAGTIALLDGSVSTNVFVAGTLADLKSFAISLRCVSKNGPWKITTGSNVHVRAVGNFT